MFRLIRYAILGALAYFAATWISESRGEFPAPLNETVTLTFAGEKL